MDSDSSRWGKTEEDELSVLQRIKEKLRPVLLSKWRASRASIVAEAMEAGLSDHQIELVLKAFRRGYWDGAVDVSSLSPLNLLGHQEKCPDPQKVH